LARKLQYKSMAAVSETEDDAGSTEQLLFQQKNIQERL
jgi:hypothetical protein